MTAENEITPAVRAAQLLASRGSDQHGSGRSMRVALRRLLLRAMRPHSHHQQLLDEQIVAALQRQEAVVESALTRDGERIERLERFVGELIQAAESLRQMAAGSERSSLERSREARAGLATLGNRLTALIDELNALPYIEGDPFESFAAPVGEVIGFRSPGAHESDSSGYAEFEDAFRGSAERVRATLIPYLELLRAHEPVLDVGCGRGELLALLLEQGIAASGVDSDAGMIARCRELGVHAELGDANEHLAGLADGSVGAVFSAQVIEHLPYQELQRLLALARRKLRPGGLFIAETVNPHRIASLKTFWVDLTHQHPIFPEVALALCGIAGYPAAYVFAPGFDSFPEARFKSPSYAVVATTPGAVR
ncbi:MAG TPA: class I SAM-dependent methyltransferase [Solirubrobacteraceae bacterium]|nr:class I SAM-dependent methyltransferase [Solirubrobacteraceae bacterium]